MRPSEISSIHSGTLKSMSSRAAFARDITADRIIYAGVGSGIPVRISEKFARRRKVSPSSLRSTSG